jgi:indole-3-glycerol phosphate synthase
LHIHDLGFLATGQLRKQLLEVPQIRHEITISIRITCYDEGSYRGPAMLLRTQSGLLAEIVEHKKREIAGLHEHAAELEKQAHERKSHPRPFMNALRAREPAIIAEIKKASPSRGVLRPNFHPAFIAHSYEQGGAACLSVLTDKQYFQGSLHDLEAARAAVSVPVLRKDFTIDRVQVFEAAAHSADAILLIAAILETADLQSLRELASSLGLASLVEVHDHDELSKAIDSGAEIIGVNNRNLDTLDVSLDTSLRLSYLLPANIIRVSESGIYTRADIDLLRGAGFQAFLVGEALMRSRDPLSLLHSLTA